MSDALASNCPTVTTTMTSLCNSHARRQFIDVINHFPEEVKHIIKRYGEIWSHDHHIAEQQLSLAKRLEYHQTHSLPVIAEIKLWGETHLADETIEANSGLGKAIRYFIKHYEGLSLFCQMAGAKLDNNAIEAMLKIVVRDRKNAMFHKTLLGAIIGDVITSMIATGSEAGVNVMDYFTLLQREQEQAKAHPENYLPWNYLENS
jgi:transposase